MSRINLNTHLDEDEKRGALLEELKGYRKIDKNVRLYEKSYHELFGTSLRTMNSEQLNDMIIFITNTRIAYENSSKTRFNPVY